MSDHQQRGGDPTRFVGLLKGYEPAPLSGTGATPASVEVCERCGAQANPMPAPWFAPNDLWNEVHGSPSGFLCPACFADAADMKGISVIFKADRAGAFEDQEAEVERLRGERDRAIETRENANAASVRVEIENQRLREAIFAACCDLDDAAGVCRPDLAEQVIRSIERRLNAAVAALQQKEKDGA